MYYRKIRALLCLTSFICGLFAASATPVLAQYNYGQIYPNTQNSDFWNMDGTTTQKRGYTVFPGIIGGVAGLAIGGATMGPAGAVAGGIGGFALGNAVATKLGPDLGPQGYPQRVNSSWMLNMIPGVAGAVLGIALTASMGPLAWIVGGVAGYAIGGLAARMLFPQLYYGGTVYPTQRTYNSTTPNVSVNLGYNQPYSSIPAAPTSTVNLQDLKDDFYEAMSKYREALKNGSVDEQKSAREFYIKAQNTYLDAKKAALK